MEPPRHQERQELNFSETENKIIPQICNPQILNERILN
jgi:hypothetical protein